MRIRTQQSNEPNLIRRPWLGRGAMLLAVLLTCLLAGCEDSADEPALAVTHDFADNDPNRVVVMGDSITVAINGVTPYPQMLADLMNMAVVNEGVSGEHAYEGVKRVGAALAHHKPGYLFALYGANDILHARRADDIVEDLRTIVHAAIAAHTIPVLVTLTPMARSHGVFDPETKSVNAFIRQLALQENVLLVDLEVVFDSVDNDVNPYVMEADDLLQWDGLHPNENGNWEIALAFADMIHEIRGF